MILIYLLTDWHYLGQFLVVSIVTLLTIPLTLAQSESFGQDEINALIGIGDLSLTEFSYLDPEQPSNLYLLLYQMQQTESAEAAMRQVAAQNNDYTYFLVRNVILANDLTGLGNNVSEQQAAAARIRKLYESALRLQKVRFSIISQNHFQQIYTDGDPDTGEFDLITDLQTIHDLLFVGKPPTYLEADPNFPTYPDFRGNSDGESTILDNTEAASPSEQFCPIDPELTASLREHNLNEAAENISEPQSQTAYVAGQIATAIPEPSFPCEPGKFFCIEVKEEYEYAQNYFPGDNNCVACRIGLINEHLSEFLTGNLYPGKITGKYGELAECKSAFFRLPFDFSVSLQGRPTPPYNNKTKDKLLNTPAADRIPTRRSEFADILASRTSTVGNQSFTSLLSERQTILEQVSNQKIHSVFTSEQSAQPLKALASSQAVSQKMQEFNTYLRQFRSEISQMQITMLALAQKPNCTL